LAPFFLVFSQVTETVDDVLEISDRDVGFAKFAFKGGDGVAETVYRCGDRDAGKYGFRADAEVVVSGLHAGFRGVDHPAYFPFPYVVDGVGAAFGDAVDAGRFDAVVPEAGGCAKGGVNEEAHVDKFLNKRDGFHFVLVL